MMGLGELHQTPPNLLDQRQYIMKHLLCTASSDKIVSPGLPELPIWSVSSESSDKLVSKSRVCDRWSRFPLNS